MADNILNSDFREGSDILAAHIKQMLTNRNGNWLPYLGNAPVAGQDLGSEIHPWGTLNARNIVLGGESIDFSRIVSPLNRIVSSRTRPNSSLPAFLSIGGPNDLTGRILGSRQALLLSVNGQTVSINTDLNFTMAAAPGSGNTCDVNNTDIVNDTLAGELDYVYGNSKYNEIEIDAAGSHISSRVGQWIGLKSNNEIMLAYVKSPTKSSNVRRGFAFDHEDNWTGRDPISNNDTLTYLNTGIIFVDNSNPANLEITYKSVRIAPTAPGSSDVGDYWFNTTISRFQRYNGSQYVNVDSAPIAWVFSDRTGIVGYRCFDFYRNYSNINNIEIERVSDTKLVAKNKYMRASIYGRFSEYNNIDIEWDIDNDLEAGLTKLNDTYYGLYLDDFLRPSVAPVPRYSPELGGYSHPYEAKRCFGRIYVDGDGNISEERNEFIWEKFSPNGRIQQTFSYEVAPNNTTYTVFSGKNPIATITRPARGTILHSFKEGFFKSRPVLIGFAALNSAAILTVAQNNVYSESALRTMLSAGSGAGVVVVLGWGGNDFLQVQLDNRLK